MYPTLWLLVTSGCILAIHAAKSSPECYPRGSSNFPQVGDEIKDCFDGCNNCTDCICTENGVQSTDNSTCTLNFCLRDHQPATESPDPVVTPGPQEGSPVCHSKGSSHFPQVGDRIQSCFDGCNACSDCICTESGPLPTPESQCTKDFCGGQVPPRPKAGRKSPSPTCHPKGSSKTPQVGDVISGCYDGCNTCSTCICTEDGPLQLPWAWCSLVLCLPEEKEVEPPTYDYSKYVQTPSCHPKGSSMKPQVGDIVPKCTDGCNTCFECLCTENGFELLPTESYCLDRITCLDQPPETRLLKDPYV